MSQAHPSVVATMRERANCKLGTATGVEIWSKAVEAALGKLADSAAEVKIWWRF